MHEYFESKCTFGKYIIKISSTILDTKFAYFVFLQYAEYEQVVVEDRVEKEKARRKAEQEAEELRGGVRVRGHFCLGAYVLLVHV